jgi:hypothetical protein
MDERPEDLPDHHWHVRVEVKHSDPTQMDRLTVLDQDRAWIEKRILEPRRQGAPRRDRLENMAKPLLLFEAHSAMQNLFRVCDYFNTIIAMRHLVVTGAPEAEVDQLIAAGHA